MIDIRLREKIQQLKARFSDADDDVKKQIAIWEADITRLSESSNFIQLPTVVNIVKLLKERLKTILIERATKGHNEILEAREKEIRYILSLFCPRYESELTSLENIIDAELL